MGNEQDVISLQLQIVCFAGKNLFEINGRLLWPLVCLVDQLAAIEGGRGGGALRQSQRLENSQSIAFVDHESAGESHITHNVDDGSFRDHDRVPRKNIHIRIHLFISITGKRKFLYVWT